MASTLRANGLQGAAYFEPFAGGAAVGLHLLGLNIASEIHLNDRDPSIYRFWEAVVHEPDRLTHAMMTTPVDIHEWRRQSEIYRRADPGKPFELGFAAFFLNRCNHSGIIAGSTPIGGYAQQGRWRIDHRFYRETLARRIGRIAEYRERIHICNTDALDFISRTDREPSPTFTYLDPPYPSNGASLYPWHYGDQDHRRLAQHLLARPGMNWIMSYDDTPIIRELYSECRVTSASLGYSLRKKRMTQELLIFPEGTMDPREMRR